MKVFLFLLLSFFGLNLCVAQSDVDTCFQEVVYFPDVDAKFPGGNKALVDYVRENIEYPSEYITTDFNGKIYLTFIVELDGTISDVKVERGVDETLDRMAVNLIRNMPNWIPAELEGKKVRCRMRYPINITLL